MNHEFLSCVGRRLIPLLAAAILGVPSAAAAAGAAQRVVVTGTLDVLQEDDFERGRTRRIFRLLEDDTERVFTLHVRAMPAADLQTGARVRVRGTRLDAAISADPDGSSVVVLAEAAAVAGERRAVVLVVDFAGDAAGAGASSVSCSQPQVADLMYTRARSSGGNLDENYWATSYGQLGWVADVDGVPGPDVFRVSIQASVAESCASSYGTWANKADSAATAAGVNLGLYQHRVYVVPNATDCGWAGLANVGCGSACRAWIKGSSCNTLDIYTHEVGHNLGMGHASTDTDNNGTIDSSCSYWGTSYGGGEYCDRSCFMGIGGDGKRHNNGAHKQQMGWLPLAQVVDAAAGVYSLAPLGDDPASAAGPQLLRIARGTGEPYLVTYRTAGAAYEDNLRAEYQQKTSIHTHRGGSSNTLLVGALADGQTFRDDANGVVITQLSHTATAATVQIGTACVRQVPGVALSPAVAAGRPGASVTYSVLVTNRNAAGCNAATFALTATAPAGWGAALASTSITLASGQQGATDLGVTSSSSATDGSYPVSVTATDGGGGGSGTGAATYCVDGVGPNPVNDLAAALKRKNQVQLTWSIPTVTGCATVAGYDVSRNGVRVATTANTSWVDAGTSSGATYTYAVIARDQIGNVSAPSNPVTITLGGGSGGGKEICGNGVDDDSDGAVDCADGDCRRSRLCR